jgi:hypothetical protein
MDKYIGILSKLFVFWAVDPVSQFYHTDDDKTSNSEK